MINECVVLVLEDHDFQRATAVMMLKDLGVRTVLQAAEGQTALHTIALHPSPVDVVLCDLQMEGMDGIQFIRHVADRKMAQAVIITSALGEEMMKTVENLAVVHQVNVLGTLKKPLNPDDLKACLTKYQDFNKPPTKPEIKSRPLPFSEIEDAVQAAHFIPYFQPMLDIKRRSIFGAEALARWEHPVKGLLPPSAFIPAMEKQGLISALTEIIVIKTFRFMSQWLAQGFEPTVGINLSPRLLQNTLLPDKLVKMCGKYSIPKGKVIFEITESAVSNDLARLLEILSRIRMKGFGLSLDDYGTGYSTLVQVRQVPFTELKIDRSFVIDLENGGKYLTILDSTIKMARQLKMRTVVEGVETSAQWDCVAGLDADVAQGYYIAKPMAGDDFFKWANKWDRFGFHPSTPKVVPPVPSSSRPIGQFVPAGHHTTVLTTDSDLVKKLHTARILIVDDQHFVLRMMVETLTQENVQTVYQASNIHEAMKVLANKDCDLIITDVELSNENGLELLKSIRCGATQAPRNLPVVVLTSHATHRAIGIATALDAQGFIVKPLKFKDVKNKIAGAISCNPEVKPSIAYDVIPTDYE